MVEIYSDQIDLIEEDYCMVTISNQPVYFDQIDTEFDCVLRPKEKVAPLPVVPLCSKVNFLFLVMIKIFIRRKVILRPIKIVYAGSPAVWRTGYVREFTTTWKRQGICRESQEIFHASMLPALFNLHEEPILSKFGQRVTSFYIIPHQVISL